MERSEKPLPRINALSIKTLILVSGYAIFFAIVLDNGRLDHQIVRDDLVWPPVLKELKYRSSHSGTSFFPCAKFLRTNVITRFLKNAITFQITVNFLRIYADKYSYVAFMA